MRENMGLYRGKRIDNGELVEGWLVWLPEDAEFMSGAYIMQRLFTVQSDPVSQSMKLGGFVEVDPATVGQYSDVPDKNGKMICERDKLRVTRQCVLAYGTVNYKNGCFWFADDGPGGMLRLCDAALNGFDLEIIGTIHDTGTRP